MFKLFRRKKKEEDEAPAGTAVIDAPSAGAPAPGLPPVQWHEPAPARPSSVSTIIPPPVLEEAEVENEQEEDATPRFDQDGRVAYDGAARPGIDEVEFEREARAATDAALERTRRGWFSRITGVFDRATIDEDLWDDLEEQLIAGDLGVEVADEIITYCKDVVRRDNIRDPEEAREVLKDDLEDILLAVDNKGRLWGEEGDGVQPSPAVILVIGVNGVGKTTSIAKLAALFKRDGEKVLLAAADTFRAAAIDQLKMWADRVGVDIIAHKPGADPGAVVYDAMEAAKARRSDVVIVDTAGRLHTKFNLMQELAKIRKVLVGRDPTAPHEVLLVVDATTGQNGLIQAKAFTEAAEVTSIFLTKLDGTAKGGIVFSICKDLGIPVRFIGTGEKATDIAPFDPRGFVDSLFG